jgi:hypothetical protein
MARKADSVRFAKNAAWYYFYYYGRGTAGL